MEIVTRGSISAASLLWQRGPGWVLTTVCKAAFDLLPGESKLRASPPAPLERDVPWDAPYSRSVRATNDLIPIKPAVDLLLTGHAYAPHGRPVPSFTVRLAVGRIDKAIDVASDRSFDRTGKLHHGPAITHMPLVYERAAGGPGSWNLAGMHLGQYDAHGNLPLPNLTPAGVHIVSPEQIYDITPAGLGPLGGDWPSRVEKLGRRSPRDLPSQWNGQSLPDDLAREYFNSAPEDQQITTFHEEETITLENLHAQYSQLTTRLPRHRTTASAEVAGQTAQIALRVDTLHIDTDHGTVTVVWRGHLPLRDAREATRLHVGLDITQPAQRPAAYTESVAGATPPARTPANDRETLFDGTIAPTAGMKALPFAGQQKGAPNPSSLSQSSMSWDAVRAPSSLAQSSASWGAREAQAPRETPREAPPSRDAAPSSSPWSSSPPTPHAGGRMAQSGSWGAVELPPDSAKTSTIATDVGLPRAAPPPPRAVPPPPPSTQGALPPPVALAPPVAPVAPPPPVPIAAPPPVPMAAPPPVPMAAPIPVPIAVPIAAPPPAAVAAVAESPWAGGSAAQKRETIGMQTAGSALAVAEPRYEPLPVPIADLSAYPGSLQLLWLDTESVARIRRVPRWKEQLDEMSRGPLDRDLDDSGAREPWEVEDRREVFEVLSRGAQTDARGVEEALAEAQRAGGKLVPPLVLVEGDLEVMFDELSGLKAATSTAAPLVTATDESLRSAVEAADTFFNRPGLLATPAVCEALHTRIREAFGREKKALAADYLDKQVERALLSGRHYQKRQVLGGVFLRSHFWMAGEKDALLAYVPEDLTKKLPMYRRFKVRAIVDIHPQVDQYETRSSAIRVLALARAS